MSGKTALLRNAAALTEADIVAIVSGKTGVTEIARKYDRSYMTILRWLRARGVTDFHPKHPSGHRIALAQKAMSMTKGDIAAIVSGKSRVSEIARKYGQSYGTILLWLDARGIKNFRQHKSGGFSLVVRRQAATLTKGDIGAIVNGRSSVNEIARKHGVTHGKLKMWLIIRGIKDYPLHNGDPKIRQAALPRWKRVFMMRKKEGSRETARQLGISKQRVQQICKAYEKHIMGRNSKKSPESQNSSANDNPSVHRKRANNLGNQRNGG